MNRRTWIARTGAFYSAFMLGPHLAISTAKTGSSSHAVRLNANENPYGCSPKALEALQRAEKNANRYAFSTIAEIKKAFAQTHNLSEEHVLIGPGSSSLLETLGQFMLLKEGDITSPMPTFDILPAYLERFGRKVHHVPITRDHLLDLEKMLQTTRQHPGLVYLVNPNNPIGTAVDPEKLQRFISEACMHSYVLVDEAYIEFADKPESMAGLVVDHPNLIVVKTLSKIYGMAGLRLGYGFAHPDTVKEIEKFQIFPGIFMATPSFAAAFAGLKDQEYLNFIKQKNAEAKKITRDTLQRLSISYIPSQTSFVLFDISTYRGDFLKDMESRNLLIGVRTYAGKKWCRVSMGTVEEMEVFSKALEEIWS